CPLGHLLPNERGGGLVATVSLLSADLGVHRAGRCQGRSVRVVDHLGVDVLRAAEDGQARPLRRPEQPPAGMPLATLTPHLYELALVHGSFLRWGSGATDTNRAPSPGVVVRESWFVKYASQSINEPRITIHEPRPSRLSL